MKRINPARSRSSPVKIIERACELAGSMTFLGDAREGIRRAGLDTAIRQANTAPIFDWLLTAFSYQGVSDQAAETYMAVNGRASWEELDRSLTDNAYPQCPLLRSFRDYKACRFDKTTCTCAEPEFIERCPVPRPRLRNGRLNQTAVSFYLFVRDVAQGNLVGWIDDRVGEGVPGADAEAAVQERLLGPLRQVFGVSDKILTMTLSELLIGGSPVRPEWLRVGTSLIAVDSLVHNFLHRTGILVANDASHAYGVGCYAPGGCADLIREAALGIDARHFNLEYPTYFPRFVQHALWRYCSAGGLGICNGNRIDDSRACQNAFCQLAKICEKRPLKAQSNQ